MEARQGRPKLLLRPEKDGFRIYPFRYRKGMSDAERARVLEALERAIKIVQGAD